MIKDRIRTEGNLGVKNDRIRTEKIGGVIKKYKGRDKVGMINDRIRTKRN